jgi:hypothetical protein
MTKPQLIQVSDFVRSLLPREMLVRLDGDGDFEIKPQTTGTLSSAPGSTPQTNWSSSAFLAPQRAACGAFAFAHPIGVCERFRTPTHHATRCLRCSRNALAFAFRAGVRTSTLSNALTLALA